MIGRLGFNRFSRQISMANARLMEMSRKLYAICIAQIARMEPFVAPVLPLMKMKVIMSFGFVILLLSLSIISEATRSKQHIYMVLF